MIPLLLEYHDREWGVPVHSDRKHFEVLVLSGAQAGLNWSLVLKKREGYRRAFDKFNPEKVARYSERQIQTLLSDPEIIRNRIKIEAAVRNALAFLKIQEEFGGFDSYCWRFVGGKPKTKPPLLCRQLANQGNSSLDSVEDCCWLFTVNAVLGVILRMCQDDLNPLKWPPFAVSIHAKRHIRT
jgi:DNA-3-methyladenine glycosylase I